MRHRATSSSVMTAVRETSPATRIVAGLAVVLTGTGLFLMLQDNSPEQIPTAATSTISSLAATSSSATGPASRQELIADPAPHAPITSTASPTTNTPAAEASPPAPAQSATEPTGQGGVRPSTRPARTQRPAATQPARQVPAPAVPADPGARTAPAPGSVGAAPAPAADRADRATLIAAKVHAGINAARASQGLAPLQRNGNIDAVATGWSRTMAASGAFKHSTTYSSQMPRGWSAVAENIAMTGSDAGADAVAQQLVSMWLNSPGHRANIMNGVFNQTGIGIAWSGNAWYATQNFGEYR